MDVVTLARTARENLARGLGALQSAGVPPQLMQAAEPIALAMQSLHRIESTRGGPGSDAAGTLALVRKALGELQVAGVAHPAVEQATEAIASALGSVHQLTSLVGQSSLAPSPPTQPSGSFQAAAEPPPAVAVVNQPAWPQQAAASPVAATQLAPNNWGQQTQPAGGAPAQPAAWQQPAPQHPAPRSRRRHRPPDPHHRRPVLHQEAAVRAADS